MAKKKKKKNKVNQVEMTRDYLNLKSRSKKQLRKEFNDAIDDIESYRIQLFEADKRGAEICRTLAAENGQTVAPEKKQPKMEMYF